MIKILVCALLVGILFTPLVLSEEQNVFLETFDDGDYTNNPEGTLSVGRCYVLNSELYCDGSKWDNTNRYLTMLIYPIYKNLTSNFNLSFEISLRTEGSPQSGQGFQIWLTENSIRDRHYDLRVMNGITDNHPINHFAFSFGGGVDGYQRDYIISNFSPVQNTKYQYKLIKINDTFSLYVDNIYIGSVRDPITINSFQNLVISSIGSVKIDNILFTNIVPQNPEFKISHLEKFAPIIYIHPDETYHPKEIGSFLDDADLRDSQGDVIFEKPVNPTNLNSNLSQRSYLDMTQVDINNILDLPDTEYLEGYGTKVYGREVLDENNYTHLQYFIFYPFQRWYTMNHEGDWELVQVTLNKAKTIESISYFFNYFTQTYYNLDLLTFVNNTHPVVYVGKGSHNNYADIEPINTTEESDPFSYFVNLLARFKNLDKLSAGGKVYLPSIFEELEDKEMTYEIEEIWSTSPYINFKGHWGQQTPYYFNNGPKGPKYNPRFIHRWQTPERATYAPNIPFISVFLYSPLDIYLIDSAGVKINETSENMLFYTGSNEEPEAIMAQGNNYTLSLIANKEGQFTLDVFYYDNNTDAGIMLSYHNITNQNITKGWINITNNSYFVLYLDDNLDGQYDRLAVPDKNITYNYTYILPDFDGDDIDDFSDNCANITNHAQTDFNNDGHGDACDNPRHYKQLALIEMMQVETLQQKESVLLDLAKLNILSSLENDSWANDFEVITSGVFTKELVAVNQLKHLNTISPDLLVKADKLILEYQLKKQANKTDNYLIAENLFNLANEASSTKDYGMAIILYRNAWELLK